MNNDNHQRMIEFINQLDKRLKDRSDELEDVHLEAAIDAQLTSINGAESNSDPVMVASRSNNNNYNDGFQGHEAEKENVVIFHDYSNPNAVSNCLSPYVPSTPEKIAAFVSWTGLSENDILLDIGCGDGRVCVAASKLSGCTSIGLDVSPPCIALAKELAKEEGLHPTKCIFYEVDATINPERLLEADSITGMLDPIAQSESCGYLNLPFTQPRG